MTKDQADRAESIRHRLRNELRRRGEDVETGLQRFATERLLYRLGQFSRHRERFVLKGATLFAIWGTVYRPTRDLDFTGYGNSEPASVVDAFREICGSPDDVDQLGFETDGITAEPIRDGSEYDGLRIKLDARLGSSRIPIQIDVGFGNAIVPGPEEVEYRTLLGDPAPRILAYPQESVVAEKLHAVTIFGERNSRYKDFYDLHALAASFSFDRDTLVRAVTATFERRNTPATSEVPAALTTPFYADDMRAAQWRAYSQRVPGSSQDYRAVGETIVQFLRPVWEDFGAGVQTEGDWKPGGPWRSK